MLHFIQSNRLEKLFDRLCLLLAESPADPLQPLEIIVQNPGMGRWISQQMALRIGIAANLHFPLPARFIWEIFAGQLDMDEETRDFDRAVLHWRILNEFSSASGDKSFEEIQQYLEEDNDGRRNYQLSARIADLFDQYLVYRPDLLLSWESGKDSGWQAKLWQKLAGAAKKHRAGYLEQFMHKVRRGGLNPEALPRQVYIFGISSLAPAYLSVIHGLSSVIDVYFFHMNPCRDYWVDIVSDAEVARKRKSPGRKNAERTEEYYFRGNPVLASLGKVGREFVDRVQELEMVEEKYYEEPARESRLAILQSDILDLVDHSDPAIAEIVDDPKDRTVQLHSCHSRMREVQVLHDRLLEMFEDDPGMKPGDIIVMAPVIDEYAPAIRSVFDGVRQSEMYIPWSIADRSVQGENPLASAFLSLFGLCRGRFTATEVISFLETEAVMRRFQIDEEGLAMIRKWVAESGIRWGLDADQRQEFCPGMDGIHTWEFGMDRIFMSYFTGDLDSLIHSISPAGPMVGSHALLLGKFATFFDHLHTLRNDLLVEKSPPDWVSHLLTVLDTFFEPGASDEDQQILSVLREVVWSFGEDTKQAGFSLPLKAPVIRSYLQEALSIPSPGHAFLSGGVTLCNMVPMRSVPFKVVCLLGMNDSDYPRDQNTLGFDLIASHPRPGDRNRRDDDCYLFLEALLSARRIFYVSWLGRNQQDNSIRPPSVVVSELIDYMERSFVHGSGGPVSQDDLVVEHPLQPFSRKCFDGTPGNASFAGQWLPSGDGLEKKPFAGTPLPEPPEEWRTVDLQQLVRFWSHPVRYFLQHRLGMQVHQRDDQIGENEIFHPDHLESYVLADRFIKARLEEREHETLFPLLQAEGKLPHGNFGRNYHADLVDRTDAIVPGILPFYSKPREPYEIDLAMDAFRITGWLTGLYEYGCARFRPARVKGRDLVKLWIEHLVYNTIREDWATGTSIHVGSDRKCVLHPVADPLDILAVLLDIYWQGVRTPINFFPESSWAWINDGKNGKRSEKAQKQWFGGFNWRGESEELEYKIALQGREPLDQTFQHLAAAVYEPLVAHLEQIDA